MKKAILASIIALSTSAFADDYIRVEPKKIVNISPASCSSMKNKGWEEAFYSYRRVRGGAMAMNASRITIFDAADGSFLLGKDNMYVVCTDFTNVEIYDKAEVDAAGKINDRILTEHLDNIENQQKAALAKLKL